MSKLFNPIKIGGMDLKNRIVMPAMHLMYTPDGYVTERLTAFYSERAAGGAGLIVVGGCSVDEYSGGSELIGLSRDEFIPGLRNLTDAVRINGCRIAAQLYHAGRYAFSPLIGRQSIAPSPVASRLTKEAPREMDTNDIRQTIDNFAAAAARAKAAGFDAVEIIASAGYIISQFLSPVTNFRKDEYGGNIHNRMRFGLEVARAVRDSVGSDYPLIFRIAGNDFVPGSHTNLESRIFASELEKVGVDAFNVTGGWHETRVPQIPMEVPAGAYTYLAQGIKSAVTKPVIACNRITSISLAEDILSRGSADLIGFARGLIADPFMPEKALKGRSGDITPCIGCNQGCLDHVFSLMPIECMVNPRAGRENELPLSLNTATPQKVIIAGGGPAGLAAAKEAALCGHRVILYEKSGELGGQLKIAGALEERRDFIKLSEVMARQARDAGCDIRTSTEIDPETITAENPDAVIMACGGKPMIPPIPGMETGNVVMAWDVLSGKADTGNDIVVIGGGAVGIETAVYLAKKGTIDNDTLAFLFLNNAEEIDVLRKAATTGIKRVRLIEMLPRLGADIGISTRWVELQLLKRYGVETMTDTKAARILPDGIVVERGGKEESISCDTVVIAAGTLSENSLASMLEKKIRVITAGDAKKPRKAIDAIREGFFAARELG
jgi:2,4-dienoyl-CoA reductase (NADPH2)